MKNKGKWNLKMFRPTQVVEKIGAGAISAMLLLGVVVGAKPLLKELVFWPISVAEKELDIEEVETSEERAPTISEETSTEEEVVETTPEETEIINDDVVDLVEKEEKETSEGTGESKSKIIVTEPIIVHSADSKLVVDELETEGVLSLDSQKPTETLTVKIDESKFKVTTIDGNAVISAK